MGVPLWLCAGVISSGSAFANSFCGIRRRLLHLSVDILQCTLRLPCLALKLAFYVSGSLSKSLFHLATKIFGITGKAILVHERIPSEIQNFNGREGKSFPSSRKTPNG